MSQHVVIPCSKGDWYDCSITTDKFLRDQEVRCVRCGEDLDLSELSNPTPIPEPVKDDEIMEVLPERRYPERTDVGLPEMKQRDLSLANFEIL